MRLNARALYLPQQERLTLPAEKQPSLQPSSGGRPVIGYCGPLSDETDIPLILKLARSRPNWTFLLGGRLQWTPRSWSSKAIFGSSVRLCRHSFPGLMPQSCR